MIYVDHMSLEQLAVHYKKFSDELALEEFRKRDRLSEQMALRLNKEPDNQMLFEFTQLKENNPNVKDEWSEVYEAGFSAGKSTGIRIAVEQFKLKLEERDGIVLEHDQNHISSRDSETESHRD